MASPTTSLPPRMATDQPTPVILDSTIPPSVQKRLKRGRERMKQDAAKRRLCMRFERGESYYYLTGKGVLTQQSVVTNPDGTGKPPHRIRNSYNQIRPIVQGKVSAATQRVPSYQVMPTSTDPGKVGAAMLAQKVALYGYEKWRLRDVTARVCQYAIGGGGEGFALPYFDPNVGPFVQVTDPQTGQTRMVGQGEIRLLVLNGNQCYWEPGEFFDDSRWHAIENARTIDDTMELPGFTGPPLKPDAHTGDMPTDNQPSDQMVLVTEYYERPCPKYPEGQRLVIANGRLITAPEPYPLRDSQGRVIDEPVIHRLAWDVDCGKDREFGLTWQLIDWQRTYQDAVNKAAEWKNRCLVPQMIAQTNSLVTRPTDEPGAVTYYQGTQPPVWEDVKPIPDSLFRIADMALRDMRAMGADEEINAAPNVAAATVQAVVEQSQARWARFVASLADWHGRLMRHLLTLVARYYTEPRLLSITGPGAPYLIPDFQGSALMGEVDVRVLPGSLDYLTREQVVNRVLAYADRQWITPKQAMLAIDRGSAESLIASTELDVARVQRVIQKIRDGTAMSMPTRQDTDPQTGQTQEVPSWMPMDMVDDLSIWRDQIGDFMKTYEYEQMQPSQQEICKLIIAGIDRLQATAAQRQVAAQAATAQQMGQANAARPPQTPQMPTLPAGT